jgi:selenophosphate synthetase-related protein
LTYTLAPYTGSTATTYTTVGVIGSSTPKGWDASTAMAKSTFDAQLDIRSPSLNDGEAKFRANDAWDVSWGGKAASQEEQETIFL